MDINLILQKIAIWALPTLFAITVHEAAHAWMAKIKGDSTAWARGRVTLNPIPHIDPIGTVVVPLLTMLIGGMMFGWAKPVPVDVGRLRYPRKDQFWVALAGPAANLAMAILWGLVGLVAGAGIFGTWAGIPLLLMAKAGITINLVLMAFNLLPIPPLDGSRMLARYLKGHTRVKYESFEKWGFFAVILLAVTGIINKIWLDPIMGLFFWVSAIPSMARFI